MISIDTLQLRGHGVWRRSRCPLPACSDNRGLSLAVNTDTRGWICHRCGATGSDGRQVRAETRQPVKPSLDANDAVTRILEDCRPARANDPAGRYLTGRGLREPWGLDLRHHEALWHSPSRREHPALVSVVRGGDGRIRALHRTYLTTLGAKAHVEPVRMALGPVGGGAVRLPATSDPGTLAVVEGIEDGLAVRDRLGCEVWAALSAGGMIALEPPDARKYREVIVVPDADKVGRDAALALARRLRARILWVL